MYVCVRKVSFPVRPRYAHHYFDLPMTLLSLCDVQCIQESLAPPRKAHYNS